MDIQWHARKQLMLDHAQQGHALIARDIDKSARKEYASLPWPAFIALLQEHSSVQCLYEVIVGEWKEFYDFDYTGVDISEAQVIDDFFHRYPGNKDQVAIKTSSVPGKVSLHFIGSQCFSNYNDLRRYFCSWIPSLNYNCYYDKSVYTHHRLIRTLYSDKAFCNRPFRAYSKHCIQRFIVQTSYKAIPVTTKGYKAIPVTTEGYKLVNLSRLQALLKEYNLSEQAIQYITHSL